MYDKLASFVVIVHWLVGAFIVLGALTVAWRKSMVYVHVPALIISTIVDIGGLRCPLTMLEKWLLTSGDITPYETNFIDHHVARALQIPNPHDIWGIGLQMILGLIIFFINLILYTEIVRRSRRCKPDPASVSLEKN